MDWSTVKRIRARLDWATHPLGVETQAETPAVSLLAVLVDDAVAAGNEVSATLLVAGMPPSDASPHGAD